MTVSNGETRILLNGCWDLAHAGHFNALRQVWEIAQTHPEGRVVAGIHSNAEIARVKGGTFVYNDAEKRVMLEACRFVDAIVCDVPYRPVDEALLSSVQCDYAVHGSDAVILKDGTDMYGPVKKAGKYIEIPRSENIATTDLIDRILYDKTHSVGFSLSARRVCQFAKNTEISWQKNTYIFGHFDLFHPGHVEILRRAKLACPESNLIVGVIPRPSVDVLTEGERLISLMSCRFVDDVVIRASSDLNPEFVHAFNISSLILVNNHPDFVSQLFTTKDVAVITLDGSDVTTHSHEIKQRIISQSPVFVERNKRKQVV